MSRGCSGLRISDELVYNLFVVIYLALGIVWKMDKSNIRHLLDLSKEEKKAFLDSFDAVMSDCDGAFLARLFVW